jgi:hypothetical protein
MAFEWISKHVSKERIQKTEVSRRRPFDGLRATPGREIQNENPKTHHESTKFGNHEKKPLRLYNPLFFRAFVPRQINGGQVSCFRDKGFFCILSTYLLSFCFY